jgi:hypothetical protein
MFHPYCFYVLHTYCVLHTYYVLHPYCGYLHAECMYTHFLWPWLVCVYGCMYAYMYVTFLRFCSQGHEEMCIVCYAFMLVFCLYFVYMYVHVCIMHVYIYTHTHTLTYSCNVMLQPPRGPYMHTYMHTYTCLLTYTRICRMQVPDVSLYTIIHMHVHTNQYMYTHVFTCEYIYIYIYIYIHTYRPPRGHTEKLLSKIREQVPDVVLRTTFITGFPGETPQDHKELVRYVRTRVYTFVCMLCMYVYVHMYVWCKLHSSHDYRGKLRRTTRSCASLGLGFRVYVHAYIQIVYICIHMHTHVGLSKNGGSSELVCFRIRMRKELRRPSCLTRYVCVNTYICIHITYTCIHIHTYAYMYTHTHTHTHTNTHARHARARPYTHTHTHIYVHVIYVHTCEDAFKRACIYIYIYIHACMHICIRWHLLFSFLPCTGHA